MKSTSLQFTRAYIKDFQSVIEGNVAQHLILSMQSADQGYIEYMTEEEIELYENASADGRAEIRTEIENWINDNFNFDISEFEY